MKNTHEGFADHIKVVKFAIIEVETADPAGTFKKPLFKKKLISYSDD